MKRTFLTVAFALSFLFLSAPPALLAFPAPPDLQVSFEATVSELKSPDAGARSRAVALLKDAAYPEAAIPLAAVVTDPDNDIQLGAIAAELNIFLADKITTRRHVALVIEVRSRIAAEAAFAGGPSALGPRPVPVEVFTALRRAAHDETPQVVIEALYAFGALATVPAGSARRELLAASAPDLAAMLGVPDPAAHLVALQVVARVFAKRPQDEVVDPVLGDAVIGALNDKNSTIRIAAMQALGAMRYERSVQALTQLFQYYGRGNLAEGALDALARIAHASSTPIFIAQLAGKNALPKLMAVEGLARQGDTARATAIQTALNSERNDAVLLAGRFSAALLLAGSIDQIVEGLTRSKLHDQAYSYLIELAPGRSNAFMRPAQDPDAHLRADVADILGLAGDPAAIAIVEPMQKDRDAMVARAAERAVARLRTPQ
jgi:HEAT repeat protein